MSVKKRILVPMIVLTIVFYIAILISFILFYNNESISKAVLFILGGGLITLAVFAAYVIILKFAKELVHWYESILDATPLPITVTDANMKWTFVNKAVENFLGTRRENMMGKPCSGWGAHICNTSACGIACAKRGLNQTFFNHKDKSYQVNVGILKGLDNETAGFIEIVQDITHILKREAELTNINEENKLQLSKLNLMIKATRIGLWDMKVINSDPVNPENPFIWSNEFRHMLGYSDEKDFPNILSSWSNLLHHDDKERTLKAFAKHLLDKSGKTPYDLEYRLLKKDGEYSYYRASGETIRDEDGNAIHVAGALMDITKEKAILLELERLKAEVEKCDSPFSI